MSCGAVSGWVCSRGEGDGVWVGGGVFVRVGGAGKYGEGLWAEIAAGLCGGVEEGEVHEPAAEARVG